MKVGQSLWINIATEHLGRHKSQGKNLRAAFHFSSSSLALWQQPAKQDPIHHSSPIPTCSQHTAVEGGMQTGPGMQVLQLCLPAQLCGWPWEASTDGTMAVLYSKPCTTA